MRPFFLQKEDIFVNLLLHTLQLSCILLFYKVYKGAEDLIYP